MHFVKFKIHAAELQATK